MGVKGQRAFRHGVFYFPLPAYSFLLRGFGDTVDAF